MSLGLLKKCSSLLHLGLDGESLGFLIDIDRGAEGWQAVCYRS